MKKLYIARCLDCPKHWETPSFKPSRCKKMDKTFDFDFNESKGFPDWCPLPDVTKEG